MTNHNLSLVIDIERAYDLQRSCILDTGRKYDAKEFVCLQMVAIRC